MGINISNTTFKMFTDFAATVSGRTRLAVDNEIRENGPLHTVKASTNWDFIGNIRRGAAKRAANNEVRTLFLNAVAELFGGENHIPDNVKAAMRMDNFGKGKPLTARRIIAVQRAIEDVRSPSSYLDYSNSVDVAAGKLRENAKPTGPLANISAEAVSNAAETAITAAGGDLDLLNVLKDTLVLSSVISSNNQLRSEDGIKAKVAAIRDNINELRDATGGDKSLFYMGLRSIIGMRGKPLNAGVITSIVNQVRLADISAMRKMSGSSGAMDIHKGIKQYVNNIETIKLNSQALASFKGGLGAEEISAVNRFIGRLLISRCTQSEQSAMIQAFKNDACGQVQAVYGDISCMDPPGGIKYTLWNEMGNLCYTFTNAIEDIAAMVTPENEESKTANVASGKSKIPGDSKLFGKFIDDIMVNAEDSLEKKTKSVIGKYVSGNGQGADIIKDAFEGKIKKVGVNNSELALKNDMDGVVLNGLHYNILTNAKDFAEAGKLEDTLFAKDLKRCGGRTRIGGEMLNTDDVHAAADQIAKFVTRGAKKYSELDGKERMKAFVVMSLITQNTMQTMSRNVLCALDPNKSKMPFSLNDDGVDDQTESYLELDFSFDAKDSLKVEAKHVNYIHSVHEGPVADPSREDTERPTAGRTVTSGFKLEIPAISLKQYAILGEPRILTDYVKGQKVEETIDIKSLDSSKAKEIEQDDTVEDKHHSMVLSLGRYFQIPRDVKCEASFKAELN